MMNECPKCGGTEIVQDLLLFTGYDMQQVNIAYVSMEDPGGKEENVEVAFRVDVCGACGYSEMRTKWHQDLLDASRKGFKSGEK
jgi:predicted nucleic-acid-binding Zn-ribbon protein